MSITPLERRVLEVSWTHGLSHLGSNLTCVGLIDQVYRAKRPDDLFLLGEGHAGLALYVVLEAHYGVSAEELLLEQGIHAARASGRSVTEEGREQHWRIPMSSGSLGQVESTAPGFALRDRDRHVWLLTSDGAMQEGICWSALRLASDLKLCNLTWWVNANGYSALAPIDATDLEWRMQSFNCNTRVIRTETTMNRFPFLKGIDAHYRKLTAEDWAWVQAQPVEEPHP